MRAERVVEAAPAFHDDAGLGERVEDLTIEKLVPDAGIEALDVAVLPRAARRDVGCFGTDGGNPVLDGFRNELRAIVGPYVLWHAPKDEEIGQDVDHIRGFELPVEPDRQALQRELVDHVQHAILSAIMGAVLEEVIGPDVIWPFRPKPDAGAIALPDAAALGLPARDLQPFLPPDPLHPLVIDHPARAPQHGGNLPVAQPTMSPGQGHQVVGQALFIVTTPRDLALCRPVLTERRTGPALRDRQSLPDVRDARPAPRGAQ